MKNLRGLHLRGALGSVRTEMWDGREHLVVPMVALMEGVIHAVNAETAEYVSADALRASVDKWAGHPIVVGHPVKDGKQISAHSPEVLEKHGCGFIRSSSMNGNRLVHETLIDPARLEKLGHKALADDLRVGKGCEVSVGSFVTTNDKKASYNGKAYDGEWTEIGPDHTALLPGGVGACSQSMGCGAHRAASTYLVTAEGFELQEEPRMTFGKIAAFFRSLMPRGWGDDEVKQELRDALETVEPGLSRGGEILRVKNDAVVYCLYPPPMSYDAPMGPQAKTTYWSRGYTFDATTQRFSVDGMRTQVEPTTVYAPLMSRAAAAKDCPMCEGTGQVTKDEKQSDCPACEGAGVMKTASSVDDKGAKTMTPEQKAQALKALATCGCEEAKIKALTTDEQIVAAMLEHSEKNAAKLKTLETAADKEAADKKAADDKAAADLKAAEDAKKSAETKLAETVAELKAASEKPLTEDEFLKKAPESIRTLVAEKKAADVKQKADLVGQLKTAQKAYTEAELNEMPIAALAKLAQVARVETVDYSGRGVAQPRTAAAEDFSAPDPYNLKALQGGAKVN